MQLLRELPGNLERTLRLRLAHTLTRAVTHAVVPTLTKALSHDGKQERYCHYCYYQGTYCNLCHYSSQADYYTRCAGFRLCAPPSADVRLWAPATTRRTTATTTATTMPTITRRPCATWMTPPTNAGITRRGRRLTCRTTSPSARDARKPPAPRRGGHVKIIACMDVLVVD